MKSLARTAGRIAARGFERQGFSIQEVLTNWRAIAGDSLAEISQPERISKPRGEAGAVLTVRVDRAGALELQHIAPLVVERVNTHFGYRAVARLQIVQGPVARPVAPPKRPNRTLEPAELAALEAMLAEIKDPALKSALSSLGQRIMSETPKGDD